MLWQSLMYSSRKLVANESAKVSILAEVRREHWLRFKDCRAGAEETSELSAASESRHAPLMDKVVNLGKLPGDRAKVASKV